MEDHDDSTPSESAEEPTLDEPLPQPSADVREGSPDSSQATDEIQVPVVMSTRAYQQEMLEESLKRNIIVAVRWKQCPPPGQLQFADSHLVDGHRNWQDSSVSACVSPLIPAVELTDQHSAVLRMQTELERNHKVCPAPSCY